MMTLRRLAFLIALTGVSGAGGVAPAGEQPADGARPTARTDVLYGCSGGGAGVLYVFEIRNYASAKPSLQVIGESRPGFGIHDLAISDTGVIYGVGKANPATIYVVNPNTGAVEAAVVKDYASGQTGLAWARDDVLYSAGFQNGEVRRIELRTGKVTVAATMPVGSGDLALDPTDGSLYLLTAFKELHRLNLADGKSANHGPLDLGLGGITIDHTGQMYAWASGVNQGDIRFLSINKKTGQQALIAEFQNTGVDTKAAGTGGLGASPVGGGRGLRALAPQVAVTRSLGGAITKP
jgi:hypothetical protein